MTETVFLSYSTRDRGQLDDLLSALHRGDQHVWFDEELGGGDVWWQQILEHIRSCPVFLFALSDNSLESKPCLAELNYALALGKPILPVQIGPVLSMRVTPLAAVEAVDFQHPNIDSGIRLITAIQRAKHRSTPLPSPLPREPTVPFAYLMRLGASIAGAELDPDQQGDLLAEMAAVIEQDGQDTAAHRDIAQLLRTLQARPDATEATRATSERLLAQLGNPPRTPASHPDTGNRNVRSRRWRIAAVVAVAVAASAAAAVFTHERPAPSAAPTGSSSVTPDRLDTILLNAEAVTTIMGASNMAGDPPDDNMYTPTSTLSDPDCLGANYVAAEPIYAGSGWSAVSNQILNQARPDNPDSSQFWVNQAAVSFPTERQAHDFLDRSANQWKGCSGRVVKDDDESQPSPWSFADLTRSSTAISQLSFQEGGHGWGCQHSLGFQLNVVVEAVACGDHIQDQATRIVAQMVNNIQP